MKVCEFNFSGFEMNSIYTLIVVIQVCMALAIIGLVLVQHGKGADMGAAFGSGASGSLFGATGSSSFLSKATGIAAAIFFCATLGLAYLANSHTAPSGGVMDNLAPPTTVTGVVKGSKDIPVTHNTNLVPPAPVDAKTNASGPASTNQVDQIPK
jgi:preprotein translocase subunit SecG